MTTRNDALRLASRVLMAAVLLAGAACKSGGDGPSNGGGGGGGPVRLTLAVRPPGADGRMAASVKIESDVPLGDGQLSFTLPETCRIVAGAAMRTINEMGPGRTVQQELAFECPAGVVGELTASLQAKDAAGKVVQSSVGAKL